MVADISGGHLNPAVSLALAINGKLEWIALPVIVVKIAYPGHAKI